MRQIIVLYFSLTFIVCFGIISSRNIQCKFGYKENSITRCLGGRGDKCETGKDCITILTCNQSIHKCEGCDFILRNKKFGRKNSSLGPCS